MVAPLRSALLQRRLAVPRAAAVRPARPGGHHRRRADAAAATRPASASYVGAQLRPALPAVRRPEPFGQLQRQRHVGRVHARPHGRRDAGRLRLDRQHQRIAGAVLRGHRADAGGHLHRHRQDQLRQALAGARLRRADRADRRRLRRRHAARPGGLASSWASTWSTASTRSASKGRRRSCTACWRPCAGKCPTGSSCPAATSATVSAFGKAFAELKELGLIDRVPRLAVINAAGANTLYRAVRAPRPALERRHARTRRSSTQYYAELDARQPPGLDDRQRHRDQPPGEPRQVPAGPGSVRRRGPRSDRPGDPRRQGPGRRGRLRLRAGQRRERRRARQLVAEGVIGRDERVVCILTGHQLKDPTATVAYHTTDQATVQRGARQPRREAGDLRQPRRGR